MSSRQHRTHTIYPGFALRPGETPSNPIVVDLDELSNNTSLQSAFATQAGVCDWSVADQGVVRKLQSALRSQVKEGYFSVKGYPKYIFFLGIDGRIYPHSNSAETHCVDPGAIGDGQKPTGFGWLPVMLNLLQKMSDAWMESELKKGHRERVKDRQIMYNKRG
jgi:hypothetical protein